MSILPAYKAHVQSRGGASLLHYLSVPLDTQLRWQSERQGLLRGDAQLLPGAAALSFDLKGATANGAP